MRQAVEMLLKHKRPAAAVFALMMALPHISALEPDLLMDALESGARTPAQMHNVVYGIPPLIQELQRRREQGDPGVDLLRLARLESSYLGLLDGHPASPTTLHKLLRDEPTFFVEVLGMIFRPRNEAAEAVKEYSEEEKRRAENAYRVLLSWQEVPGSRDGRTVDEKVLRDWIEGLCLGPSRRACWRSATRELARCWLALVRMTALSASQLEMYSRTSEPTPTRSSRA